MAITISSISRPLTITMTISITTIVSMESLWASVGVAGSMAITISSISRPLTITMTISITTIVSMESLWASVGVAGSMAITISWLSFSRPLTISVSNVISVGVRLWVITISMVSLGHMDRSSSISMTIAISWLSISRPLAITMTISTISISTIVSMKTLRTPVCVAAASIGMESYTTIAIARLSSGKAGKGHNNRYNLSCHGYKCIPSSVR